VLLNPAIMALILVSAAVTLMLALAAAFALEVLRHWDIDSGSERQLSMERRTYLISTLLTWVFAAELISLLLFIYNAEALSSQFVGAMCATGVLNVNAWGWPALFLKIAVFFAGASWLALNHLDNQGYDYPLIRLKYGLLLLILPLALAEFWVQLRHFLELRPDVITSCCGALFSADAKGVAAEVSGLAPGLAALLLYGSGALVLASGLWSATRGSGGHWFACLAVLAFGIALLALVSYIALYLYEHPHHHCPFCILKAGHGYIGYLLYLPLFGGTALALGAGITSPWRKVPSLASVVGPDSRRLAAWATALFALFYLVATAAVLRSSLSMRGAWW
jgi:hypothetical protein